MLFWVSGVRCSSMYCRMTLVGAPTTDALPIYTGKVGQHIVRCFIQGSDEWHLRKLFIPAKAGIDLRKTIDSHLGRNDVFRYLTLKPGVA